MLVIVTCIAFLYIIIIYVHYDTQTLNLREEGLKMLTVQRNLAREERWMLQEEHKVRTSLY